MISNLLKISSLMSSVSLDPMDEPIKAPAIQIRAGRSLINPLMARRAVETQQRADDEILCVSVHDPS